MRRFYLSKIKQVTDPVLGTVNRHRFQEMVALLGLNIDYLGGEIKVDANGQPTEKALLILVGAASHKAFQNDPDLVPMPDVALDVKVSSVHTATKVLCKTAIKALGIPDAEVETVWANADGIRDVVNHYGKKNNPLFDANSFDLTDL